MHCCTGLPSNREKGGGTDNDGNLTPLSMINTTIEIVMGAIGSGVGNGI